MTLNEIIADRHALLAEVESIDADLTAREQQGADRWQVWLVRQRLHVMRLTVRAQLRVFEGVATTDMVH